MAPAVLFLALACGESLGPSGEKVIKVEDNDFDPSTKTVAVGETVQWQWAGSNGHNVTFVDPIESGGVAPASQTQATGTYSLTFNAPGTYDFYCTIHGTATSGMHGTIVVQ